MAKAKSRKSPAKKQKRARREAKHRLSAPTPSRLN